jgi:hypothetical protein
MNNARFLVLYAVAALSACHGDSAAPLAGNPAPHVAAPVVVRKGPSAAQQTKGMVEAATQGKSTAQVELKFDLIQKPRIGQPSRIDIAVLPQIDASPVNIEILGTEGLQIASGVTPIEIPSVDAGEVYRQSIQVTPITDGVLLLALSVALKHDEITESRVFSIPLIVDR